MQRRAGIKLRLMVLAAATLGLCPHGASAAENSPRLDGCLAAVVDNEHGSRWPAVAICYETELDAQDRRLQSLYRTLEAAAPRLGGPAMDQIATSRRQWQAYRDAWCAFEQDHAVAPNADVARLSCRIEVTRVQADRVAEQAAAIR
jgi:uncharacterized protein YecT (DUF1311 family)